MKILFGVFIACVIFFGGYSLYALLSKEKDLLKGKVINVLCDSTSNMCMATLEVSINNETVKKDMVVPKLTKKDDIINVQLINKGNIIPCCSFPILLHRGIISGVLAIVFIVISILFYYYVL